MNEKLRSEAEKRATQEAIDAQFKIEAELRAKRIAIGTYLADWPEGDAADAFDNFILLDPDGSAEEYTEIEALEGSHIGWLQEQSQSLKQDIQQSIIGSAVYLDVPF